MAGSIPSPPTVGMRIDAVIAGLHDALQDGPSTPHLYAAVIAVSLAFAFSLLNGDGSSAMAISEGGGGQEEEGDSPRKPNKAAKGTTPSPSSSSSSSSSSAPEPKWHILKTANYVASSAFLLSVLQFASDASTYLNDSASLLRFLAVWSVFLCYFFGFFGISFIDPDDFADEGQQRQQQEGGAATAQQQQQQQGVGGAAPARKSVAPDR